MQDYWSAFSHGENATQCNYVQGFAISHPSGQTSAVTRITQHICCVISPKVLEFWE